MTRGDARLLRAVLAWYRLIIAKDVREAARGRAYREMWEAAKAVAER